MCVRHAKVTTVCGVVTVIEDGVAQRQGNYELRECATTHPLCLGIYSYSQSSMISIRNLQARSLVHILGMCLKLSNYVLW